MTALRSLLYVSQCLLPLKARAPAIDQIVQVSVARNGLLGVTGALIATDTRFAQVLEGPGEAVEELMASITRDERHTDIRVAFDRATPDRRFADWSMAYSGTAGFVNRLMGPPAAGPGLSAEGDWRRLVAFMEGMAGR